MKSLDSVASDLAATLERHGCKIVLAESCTAGLAAALLGGVPGISRYLCGSIVVYQDEFKTCWLDIEPSLILEHTSVSAEVTKTLAVNLLRGTPFADFSCAVTGHLGPDAPPAQDGTIYVAVAMRRGKSNVAVSEESLTLTSKTRIERQHEAARMTLGQLRTAIEKYQR